MEYSKRLIKCRGKFPFKYWLEDFNEGIGSYSEENCEIVERVFNDLIESLINLGENAKEKDKVELFKSSVFRLNLIKNEIPQLIETMEREEFCELFDNIAIASDICIEKFEDGIASKWRSW